ncbi:MAG TPA: hypothetical protein VF204_19780 [Streptosporangiaceae bacterium]
MVILSGDTGRSTEDDLLAAGAAGFLPKPFGIADFVAASSAISADPPAVVTGEGLAPQAAGRGSGSLRRA